MSLTPTAVGVHPILGCARQMVDAAKNVADVQPIFMTTSDKQHALVELAAVESRVAELRLRVLAASDEVGDETAARDTAAWVAHHTQIDPNAARADVHLAKALDQREHVAAGMRDGKVSAAQATVITKGLDELPERLGPDLATRAEESLVGFCDRHRPSELRRLARRILDVVAPEIAEAELSKKLDAEEQRAREKASLKFSDLGDGSSRLSGVLPTLAVHRLLATLDAFTNPRRDGQQPDSAQDPGPFGNLESRVPLHRRRAWAFMSLLELLEPDQLPEHAGETTTVMVTISIDQLRADLATARLLDPTGNTDEVDLSASEARRMACNANIIPAVLGGSGEVLDLGRTRRLYTKAQRRAVRLRDKRCRAEGCTIPAKWTEAHHLKPWSEGGSTDLNDAVSLCSHHHHRIHDRAYEHDRLPNGDYRFHRRT